MNSAVRNILFTPDLSKNVMQKTYTIKDMYSGTNNIFVLRGKKTLEFDLFTYLFIFRIITILLFVGNGHH